MSFYTALAEIGEGDEIQVRIGDPLERLVDATVVRAEADGSEVRLVCTVTGEAPEWILEQIRCPVPSRPNRRWWKRRLPTQQ